MTCFFYFRSSRTSDGETKTNPLDRVVAHLLFHTPPELSGELLQRPSSAKFPLKLSKDYIGYIHKLEEVMKFGCATGKKISGNTVKFTLWNATAENSEVNKYIDMEKPVVLAITSCYVKRYADTTRLLQGHHHWKRKLRG